jgi:tRNA threonylcarbamoyladenosine biosynthesis protein TsaB
MSLILNIDSSLQRASVSIANNGIIINERSNENQKDHATFIHAAVKSLLEGISFADIDAIAVTIGPGSYTGLRVGLAAAKGLCYALNKPLISVVTLQAIANTIVMNMQENADFYICPMIDARRMEVFTALYNNELDEIVAPKALILNDDSFSDYLSEKKIFFLGDGMPKWRAINTKINSYYIDNHYINSSIAHISYQSFLNKDFANLVTTSPLYVKEFYSQQ